MNNKEATEKIGAFLESARISKNVSLFQIAKDLGVSRSNLGRVFSGKNCVTAILLFKLIVYLEIPAPAVQDFIYRAGQMSNYTARQKNEK